jgi:hypothetical protein
MLPEVRVPVTMRFSLAADSDSHFRFLHHLKISRWNVINQTFATP